MPINPSSVENLRRVFQQGFTAQDIAEPLASFDATTCVADVKSFMEKRKFKVVGVRLDGLVAGYVDLRDLSGDTCADCVRSFEDSRIVLASFSLSDVVLRLRQHSHAFVATLGAVGGIISRSDFQKPAVRMWLFGMVTLIELRLTRLIEQFVPQSQWHPILSEGRVQKAKALLAERTRRNQQLNLLDCLQFSDKAKIVGRSEELLRMTQFSSKRELESAAKLLENLRNNLAHSQDIVTTDWETIVLLTERLDTILAGPMRDE